MSLSDTTRTKLNAAWHMFLTTFFVALFAAWKSGISWSWPAVLAILTTIVGAALQAAINYLLPPSLGGKRQ